MSDTSFVPQPFLGWYDIWAGQASVNDRGETRLKDPPTGVTLSVQPARRSEIFFRSEKPWEQVRMVYPCIILDEGRCRMWFWTWGEGENRARYNGYAESPDGFSWDRPELGLASYEGSTSNNLLSRHDEFEINSVFPDPTAVPEERFKAIGTKTLFFRDGQPDPRMDWNRFNELRTQTGHHEDPTVNAMHLVAEQFGVTRENAVMGAVSADGLRWRVLEEPLVIVGNSVLDTQNVAAYEPETREYVAYLRGMFHNEGKFGYGGRRAVRKVSGAEFGNWGPPHYVLVADP